VLTEAKRQLVFTSQPIHEIAYDLAFSDPSHFARFFRKQNRHHAARIPRRPGRLSTFADRESSFPQPVNP
jgi:transcriptional regulator GlxA family with amidase domain